MAKACAGSLSRLATATGHGIFAGIAFTVEHDMQLYTMRSKIAESNLGDTDYHLAKLGAQMGL
jgi:alkylation response protein AidB-like acyl-CoA dehydrogenase